MPGVSLTIAKPMPPMPYRSLVDGSPVTHMTEVRVFGHGYKPNVISIPLDAANRERFLRHSRRWRSLHWAYVTFPALAILLMYWLHAMDVHETYSVPTLLLVGGPAVWRLVVDGRRPPQYPRPLRDRMLFDEVHPETAREWQELAGTAVEVWPSERAK
jgi:hypothetical protein